ncbi:Oidioi.mRNA.OKI2018_I69.chr2.g4517.t1.cds [Oikopleura dioica]|uniref:Diacylglycerol kinase n=1 Tax=Oikopleura dioica TaxID=34765 RepID=A0ABN7SZ57_OIKDI|nr:Oidioi.mRNA.OKI2018_I69.chr2.g4517.t1.cds [Oikopleura dioica]
MMKKVPSTTKKLANSIKKNGKESWKGIQRQISGGKNRSGLSFDSKMRTLLRSQPALDQEELFQSPVIGAKYSHSNSERKKKESGNMETKIMPRRNAIRRSRRKLRLRPRDRKNSEDEEWTDIVEKRPAVKGLTMTEIVQVAIFKEKLQSSVNRRKEEEKRKSLSMSRNSSRPSSATLRSSRRIRSRASRRSGSSSRKGRNSQSRNRRNSQSKTRRELTQNRRSSFLKAADNPVLQSAALWRNYELSRRLSTGDNIGRFTEPSRVAPVPIQPSRDPLPIWKQSAEPDAHLWTDCDSSNESCYLKSQPDCKSKSSSRERCNACRIAVHTNCKKKNQALPKCRVTFNDGHQTSSLAEHKWVKLPRASGRCSYPDCREKFDKSKLPKMLSTEKKHSEEEAPVMCSWCKQSYHYKCAMKLANEDVCDFGEHRQLVVPPSWIHKKSDSEMEERDDVERRLTDDFEIIPEDVGDKTPLLVFINPKSGGNQGHYVLAEMQYLLNPRQIFDLTKGGPKQALELFRDVPNLRILCAGGDGTCGWVMSTIDDVGFAVKPPVAILPLGTGNDLSRSFDWGGGYTGGDLSKILKAVENGKVSALDRWNIDADEEINLPLKVLNNYFTVGVDAEACLKFHSEREQNPDKFNSRLGNKILYTHYGVMEFLKFNCASREMYKHVNIICDGEDMTAKLERIKACCVMLLNIKSYSGGFKPWDESKGKASTADEKIEVLAFSHHQFVNLYLAKGTGESLGQFSEVELILNHTLALQVDGEPVQIKVNPSASARFKISHRNQHRLMMRRRGKDKKRVPEPDF